MYRTVEDDSGTMVVIPAYQTKVCPRCGQGMFYDMDVCYGCLATQVEPEPAVEEEQVPVDVYPEEAEHALAMRIASNDMEVTVPLTPKGLLVGRAPTCDVVLHARAVSREHVRIGLDQGGAVVHDCGSTNLAHVGEDEVASDAHMDPGDVLSVCGTHLTLMSTR